MQTPNALTILYSVPTSDTAIITHIEALPAGQNSFIGVATTTDVVFLSEKQPEAPLLSWKHDRDYDPSLEIRAVRTDLGESIVVCYQVGD